MATLRTMVTKDEFDRFVAALPPRCAALILDPPLAISWVPMDVTSELYEHLFDDLFGGSAERMCELGRRQMIADMSTMYRVLMRFASPSLVATRAAAIYGMYSRDGGAMRVVREEPRALEMMVEGHPFPSRGTWPFMRGAIHGVIELTGVKNVQVMGIEGGAENTWCLYRVTWD